MSAYSGTPSNVVQPWWEGDANGKRLRIRKIVDLTISSQGGATNSIGYAALGFASAQIQSVTFVNYTDGSSQNRGLVVWTDGSKILLGDPQVATDADRCEPIDLTGTLRLEIAGLPA